MPCSLSLKTVLRKIEALSYILFFLLTVSPRAAEAARSYYEEGEDGILQLQIQPSFVSESLIRHNIEEGHRSELFFTLRIRISRGGFFSMGGEYREIKIRRTGFRDRITGDYILLMNDREIAVFRDWASFFRLFAAPFSYGTGIEWDASTSVRMREALIYKKLVPPFNILYLLPGRYIRQGPWEDLNMRGES